MSNDKMVMQEGRPADTSGRPDKEIRVYDLLDSLGIQYERIDHDPLETMEACADVDRLIAPAVVCKNLFLCNTQKTNFYLLMIEGDKHFKTKEISHQIGSARLSFATADFMEKFLDITPGSVSVMGLMNDKENKVKLLIDSDLINSEYIGCHPCINTSSLRLRTADITGKFLKAVHHDYQTVLLS